MVARVSGEDLEKEVERLYRLLGAEARRRVLIKTYEIDVLAVFRRGPMTFTVIVECKEYNANTRVSDQDMRSFVTKLLAARESGKADSGVFVTTSAYAKTALATASLHNIQCLTLRELYDQLVDFSNYYEYTTQEFANSPLASWYVDQTASDVEDFDTLLGPALTGVLHHPLLTYVDSILFGEGERRLAILGNFGTGKSSFSVKYRDVLLKRWHTSSISRLPVLISLANCRSGLDIHQIVTNELQRLPGVVIDLQLCMELQRMGRFVFILDGFDEMASKVDRVVINENLREIDRLHNDAPNLVLVTCRTHFFQERVADEFLADYRIAYLKDWDRPELEEYFFKRCRDKAPEYLAVIDSDPGLTELSRTPMLVDMILRSLSSLDAAEGVDAAALYSAYTNEWIVEQSKRRGSVMSTRQRLQFLQILAAKLFCEGRTTLHFSELYQVARDLSGYVDATRIDYFDTDARTSTFITRDMEGNYGFRHRSFLEYFVATIIAAEMSHNSPDVVPKRDLPQEVVYFLQGMTAEGPELDALRTWAQRFDEETLSRNAAKLMIAHGLALPDYIAEHFGAGGWSALGNALATDDDSAMEAFLESNQAELRRIIERYWYRYAAEFGRASYDVDDLFAEVLSRLWIGRDKFRLRTLNTPETLRVLDTLVRTLASDRQRLAERAAPIPLHLLDLDQFDPRAELMASEFGLQELWQEIGRIFDRHNVGEVTRAVFRANVMEEKGVQEIASEYGMSRHAVQARLIRCRSLVKSEFRLD